ncbi:RNA polymerase sigma factor [Cesiribacter sp. SM1]|uniref:RNA polymerase sigma factor n=1 Tax=Cesiribacter sp. SM1 TaxID=2861196 RepID=UPI001CD38C8B|nr:sigma-70 family RNA polymerase sigma factor [Cesiribacter sp. SM1]
MRKNGLNDSELVLSYKNGNEEAFKTLVERHKSRIYTAIYLIVKDAEIAEDLLQDSFVKAINTIQSGRYNEEGKFLPWILRIAHNLAIDYFRKQKRYPVVNMEYTNPVFNTVEFSEGTYEDEQIRHETHNLLYQLIAELPDAQRDVLIRRHFMQMSFQEIADATGVSINTALGRMRYALINLRKKMESNNIAYDQNLYPG